MGELPLYLDEMYYQIGQVGFGCCWYIWQCLFCLGSLLQKLQHLEITTKLDS